MSSKWLSCHMSYTIRHTEKMTYEYVYNRYRSNIIQKQYILYVKIFALIHILIYMYVYNCNSSTFCLSRRLHDYIQQEYPMIYSVQYILLGILPCWHFTE